MRPTHARSRISLGMIHPDGSPRPPNGDGRSRRIPPATRSNGVLAGIVGRITPVVGVLAVLAMILPPPAAPAREGRPRAADYPLDCYYFGPELDRFARCARREGDAVRIAPVHARRMAYEHGLAEVRLPGIGCLWARRDGLARPVFIFDNGPDPFVQGLVRGWHEGKVAFYDRRLRLVLATDRDWSFPFNGRGQALVCQGCRSDGHEHASMIGGRWGIIDRAGHLVVPLSEGDEPSRRFFEGER